MSHNKLTYKELNISFKIEFKHSSFSRNKTESVIVTIVSEKNNIGYGECCPRSYVTSESITTVKAFIDSVKDEVLSLVNLQDVYKWIDFNKNLIDSNPAAWCAIETALLDVMAKDSQKTIEELSGLSPIQHDFYYSAVLGINKIKIFTEQYNLAKYIGFKKYKIKLSGDLVSDLECLSLIDHLEFSIRADANNLWSDTKQAIDYINSLKQIEYIEEPLVHNKLDDAYYRELHSIYKKTNKKIILDESFTKIEQFEYLLNSSDAWVINLRISKMGGIIRSLAIAKQAKRLSIPLIIGAQVGETSILTRAAITVANQYHDIVYAQEGAAGTHLLEYDITDTPIMFGKGGVISKSSIPNGFGLGLYIQDREQA